MHALKTTIRTKRLAAAALATSALLGQATLTLPAEAASRDLYVSSSDGAEDVQRFDVTNGSFTEVCTY